MFLPWGEEDPLRAAISASTRSRYTAMSSPPGGVVLAESVSDSDGGSFFMERRTKKRAPPPQQEDSGGKQPDCKGWAGFGRLRKDPQAVAFRRREVVKNLLFSPAFGQLLTHKGAHFPGLGHLGLVDGLRGAVGTYQPFVDALSALLKGQGPVFGTGGDERAEHNKAGRG